MRRSASKPRTDTPLQTGGVIGVLAGEGIGPEIVAESLGLLGIIEELGGARFEIRQGGPIGCESLQSGGAALSPEVIGFCREVFAEGGAILAGAGGDRFVYDMRCEFDLHYKLNPIDSSTCFHYGSRRAIKPRYQLMYGLTTPCRCDITQTTWENRYPAPTDASPLRKMVSRPWK